MKNALKYINEKAKGFTLISYLFFQEIDHYHLKRNLIKEDNTVY